jgi:cell volume regulation protein A
MRTIEPRPWSIDVRFADEPEGLSRHVVAAGSPADGHTVAEVSTGDDDWISLISRAGRNVPVRNTTRLRAGDVVLTQVDGDEQLASRFEPPEPT